MTRQHINPVNSMKAVPRGYSHAIKIGTPGALLFIAGQAGTDAEMKLVGHGIEEQTEQTFRNIERLLKEAGMGFKDVVKIVVYCTDIEAQQWPIRNVRARFIDVERPPVSTMVQISRLALPGMVVEIDVIAAASI